MVSSDGHPIGQIRGQDHSPADFLALMIFRNFISTSSILMAKSHCLKEHPYDPSFRHAEDYELMLRLAHLYRFYYLDLPLVRYRRHTTNLSNNLDAHRASELRILQQYDRTHIEHVVEQTTFAPEEKLMLKGRIFFGQGRVEEALSVFKELTSGLALFYQGNCFLRLQQSAQALHAYQQALLQDPSNAASYNNLGVAYALEGKLNLAKECFLKALNLKAGYMDAQFNLHHSSNQWRITWRELRNNLLPYQEKR
jgi:tetratricopeptide (TPR) repeat protein